MLQTGVQSAGAVNKLAAEIEQPEFILKLAFELTAFPFETRFVKVTVCGLVAIAKFCPFTIKVPELGALV